MTFSYTNPVKYGLGKWTERWTEEQLNLTSRLRLAISSMKSRWRSDNGTDCTLSKFADDRKLRGAIHTPESCAGIQWDLNKLEKWDNEKFMKFNKGK